MDDCSNYILMSRMKRDLLIIGFLCFAIESYAIKPILVKFKCNLKTINVQEGDKKIRWTLNDPDGGWCYIYKTKHPKELVGHNGFLIYKNPYTGEYKVYDLKCPMCERKKQNTSVQMDETVTATCPKCGTSYNLCGVLMLGLKRMSSESKVTRCTSTVRQD